MRTTASYTVIAAAGAALTLLLAGCGQGTDNADDAAQSSRPTSSTTASSSSAPSTTQAPATPNTTNKPAAKPDAGPSPGLCTSGDVRLSLGTGGAAAGTYYAPLRFTNTSEGPCVIQGYPGVSYVAGNDGHQVGPAAYREGTKGSPVTLKPGGVAHTTVGFVQVRNYDPAVCRPTQVRGLRVYPPQETESKFLRVSGREGCAGNNIPGNQLTVDTIEAGPGDRAN